MTGVEYVRSVCKEKKIPISKLEKDLGYGNGYLNPKKNTKIDYNRAVEISEYLGCDLNKILGNKTLVVKVERPEKPIEDILYGEGASILLTSYSMLNQQSKNRLLEYAKQLYIVQEMAKEE